MTVDCHVEVRFHQPPPPLTVHFTTFYHCSITVAGDGEVTDWLHPEWANLRLVQGSLPDGQIGDQRLGNVAVVASGPTSLPVRFTVGTHRLWGIGLLPLGWARFVGVPAEPFADRLFDPLREPAFAGFLPLFENVFGEERDEAAELERITAHFLAQVGRPVADEARIVAVHEALVDTAMATVGEMVERTGLGQRTLERVCRRWFGFNPSLLLRRQRFMRSLAQFMLDPSRTWSGSLDDQYYDQAQFIRDFHRFMGMGPREYAAADHPILAAVMRQRAIDAGAAVQALHPPRV